MRNHPPERSVRDALSVAGMFLAALGRRSPVSCRRYQPENIDLLRS
jgi:hypothetical protein